MANATDVEVMDTSTFESKLFTWEFNSNTSITVRDKTDEPLSVKTHGVSGLGPAKITIPYVLDLDSIIVKNTNAEGKQAVLYPLVTVYKMGTSYFSYLPSTTNEVYTEIYFQAPAGTTPMAQAGDDAKVFGLRRIVNGNVVTVKTDSTTAKGSFWAHWPVYSSGSDCSESTQKGVLHLHIFRCRVTQLPGSDSSYKSAQAPGITVSAMDAKRPDKKFFELCYEDLTEKPMYGPLKSLTLTAGSTVLTLSPTFDGQVYEYTATLPSSVADSARLTVAAVRNSDAYTHYSISLGGDDYPVSAFSGESCSGYTTVNDFRSGTNKEVEVCLQTSSTGPIAATYTITVTVQ